MYSFQVQLSSWRCPLRSLDCILTSIPSRLLFQISSNSPELALPSWLLHIISLTSLCLNCCILIKKKIFARPYCPLSCLCWEFSYQPSEPCPARSPRHTKLPKPKTTTKPSHSHHLSFSIPTFSYFLKNNRYSDPHFFTSNSRFYQTLTSVSRRQHHPCAPVLPSLRVTVLIYVPPTDTCLLHPFSLYSISTTLPITTCQIGSNCIFLVPSLWIFYDKWQVIHSCHPQKTITF